jgi:hypothetical protein
MDRTRASPAISPDADRHALRDQFVDALLGAVRPLQAGPDPEVALEALIEAADVVGQRLRQELAELRVEQVD